MIAYNNRIYRRFDNEIAEFVDPNPESSESVLVYKRLFNSDEGRETYSYSVYQNKILCVYKLGFNCFMEILDLDTGTKVSTPVQEGEYRLGDNIAFNGDFIVSFAEEGFVNVFDVQSAAAISRFEVKFTFANIRSWDVVKQKLFVLPKNEATMVLRMYDLRSGKEELDMHLGEYPKGASFLLYPLNIGYFYIFSMEFILRINIATRKVDKRTFNNSVLLDAPRDHDYSIEDYFLMNVYDLRVVIHTERDVEGASQPLYTVYRCNLRDIFGSTADPVLEKKQTIPWIKFVSCSYFRNSMILCSETQMYVGHVDADFDQFELAYESPHLWVDSNTVYTILDESDEHGFYKVKRKTIPIKSSGKYHQTLWNTFDFNTPISANPCYQALVKRSLPNTKQIDMFYEHASYFRCPLAHKQILHDVNQTKRRVLLDQKLRFIKERLVPDAEDEVFRAIVAFDLNRAERIGENDALLRLIAEFL